VNGRARAHERVGRGELFFTVAAALQHLETVNVDRDPDRVGERRRLRVASFGAGHCRVGDGMGTFVM
jgi:hypothetical protein